MKRRIRHNWQVGLMAALATLLYFGFPSTVLASEIHEVKVEAEAGEADEISETSEVAETRETNEAGEVSETNEENSATTFEKDAPPENPPPPEIKSALSTVESDDPPPIENRADYYRVYEAYTSVLEQRVAELEQELSEQYQYSAELEQKLDLCYKLGGIIAVIVAGWVIGSLLAKWDIGPKHPK